MTRKTYAFVMFLAVGVVSGPRAMGEAKPSSSVLPASTKFIWSIADQQDFQDRLATTGLGKMLLDPVLKPFLDDLPRQMRNEASSHPLGVLWIDLGVESADLDDLSEGEVTWALVHPEGEKPARVLMADVAGRQEQVDLVLQKITASMDQQSAQKTEASVGDTVLNVFDIPAAGNLAARKLIYFQAEDLLVFTEAVSVAETLLANIADDSAATLGHDTGCQQVVKQCRERAGSEPVDAVLFLVPVDLSEALQQLSPKQDERVVRNLEIARKHNFDAISAVGGFVTVGRGSHDFHLRVAVHAPQPWKNGMRICKCRNTELNPPAWIRSDSSGFTMLNFDFVEVAKYVGPLFDDVYGEGEEGLYDDLKYTLLEDPDGPQIDIDKEVFGRFSSPTVLLARDVLPVTPDSPQRLIAIPATDEAALKAVVKKVLEADPNSEAGQIAGHDAFFSYMEETDEFGFAPAAGNQDRAPNFITCVANGHLMFATDAKILEDALTQGEALAEHPDFAGVTPHLKHLGEETCLQYFGRLQDALRVPYELFREGKKPNSAKSFKGLLSNIAAGEPPEVEEPEFDGSKLPSFDDVQGYLGLSGLVGIATEDGWFLEGFILKQP